jgi:hypothetical protein
MRDVDVDDFESVEKKGYDPTFDEKVAQETDKP